MTPETVPEERSKSSDSPWETMIEQYRSHILSGPGMKVSATSFEAASVLKTRMKLWNEDCLQCSNLMPTCSRQHHQPCSKQSV